MRSLLVVVVLFGCQAKPEPLQPPEPNLAVEVARLGDELKACMVRENDRLRAESAQLKIKIERKTTELETLTRKK